MARTLQQRNKQNTARREKRVLKSTLFIPVRSWVDREELRSRMWYSGASDTYIATNMNALQIAVSALMQIRRTREVRLSRSVDGSYILDTD